MVDPTRRLAHLQPPVQRGCLARDGPQGHWVIGQFRDAATTNPLAIIDLAGYHFVALWQATRTPAEHGVPVEELAKLATRGRERSDIVISSYVCLMTAHWPD
ncbi:MAG: hypothetical protein OXL38_10005 [Gammaproteobacteria bacterium]|nr:hypothetical protein [Gammaproteobacteria bacterium]